MVNKLGGADVGNGVWVVYDVAVLTGKVGTNGPGSGTLPQLYKTSKRIIMPNKRVGLVANEYFEINI